jgi:hypothetical protein
MMATDFTAGYRECRCLGGVNEGQALIAAGGVFAEITPSHGGFGAIL